MKKLLKSCGAVLMMYMTAAGPTAWAQETTEAAAGVAGLSLFEIIRSGGPVMVILGMLSVVALALILTYFIIISPRKESPRELVRRFTVLLEGNDIDACIELCDERDEMIAGIVRTGLRVAGQDRAVVIEAMQSEGARQAATLWQHISYLSNVGIAFEVGAVRPIVLASGIAQALVTTATGLVVAIPVMAFYFYFRGRVQKVISVVEGIGSELVEPIASVKVDK